MISTLCDRCFKRFRKHCPSCHPARGDPKQAAGKGKVSMEHLPATIVAEASEAMRSGALKYGRFNWTDHSMKASTYYDALLRHIGAWYNGRDKDPETGLHPMAHVIASAAIVLTQYHLGKLSDDRPTGLPDFEDVAARLLRCRQNPTSEGEPTS